MAKEEKKAVQKQPNRIQRYFRETMGELRKVTWPTRQEATNLTIVVLIRAASHFLLGAGLGSTFYSLFPPKPSFWQVVWAAMSGGLFVTSMSLLVGMLSDPSLKRAGLQQAQLHRLIDAMEDQLHLHLRKRIKPAVKNLVV